MIWSPHRFQMQALESRARFTFLPKGWRGGFSSFMPKVLEMEMMRCGPGNENLGYFIIAPTLKVATKHGSIQTTIHSYFCNVMEYCTYNQQKHTFYTTKEGEVKLWGHAQAERTPITVCHAADPDSFASATFLGGIADEVGQKAFPRESWNTLRSRMMTTVGRPARNNPPEMRGMGCGRVWAGSTVYTLNWFVELFEKWEKTRKAARTEFVARLKREQNPDFRAQMWQEYRDKEYYGLIDPEFHFIRFDSLQNPTIPQEEIQRLREVWPAWFFDMRIRAIPTRPAGTIYEHFDATRHVIPRFEIPANARRFGEVDFGKKNFYAKAWFEDPTYNNGAGRWICYAAYHRTDLSPSEHGAKLAYLFPEVPEWVAGQISEADDRAQLATGGLPSKEPAFKPLWLGINNFASAIKLDKVFFFDDLRPARIAPEKAVNFIDEIKEEFRSYSRPIDPDTGEVKLDEDPEEKSSYHWCFVAGTLVDTEWGMVPIESIEQGDFVWTREGLRPVESVGFRHAENLFKVTFSNGETLTGTGDHPVWIEGRGFVRLDTLRYKETVSLSPRVLSQCPKDRPTAKALSSKGSHTTGILTLRNGLTAIISSTKVKTFTGKFGSFIMARFPKTTRFITLTATHSTTTFPTFNLFTVPFTAPLCAEGIAQRRCALTWKGSGQKQRHGTQAPRESNGIANTGLRQWQIALSWRWFVRNADVASGQNSLSPDSARASVKPHGAARIVRKILSSLFAPSAALLSLVIAGPKGKIAHWLVRARQLNVVMQRPLPKGNRKAETAFVVSVEPVPPATVYNLSVSETPEFFANGVLVHNCDGCRYFGTWVFAGLSEGVILATQKGQQHGDSGLIAQVSAKKAQPNSDVAIASNMSNFRQERHGHRYDPLF